MDKHCTSHRGVESPPPFRYPPLKTPRFNCFNLWALRGGGNVCERFSFPLRLFKDFVGPEETDNPLTKGCAFQQKQGGVNLKSQSKQVHSSASFGKRQRGGKRIVRFLGGGRTVERALQNQSWSFQKVGFVWSLPDSSKEK